AEFGRPDGSRRPGRVGRFGRVAAAVAVTAALAACTSPTGGGPSATTSPGEPGAGAGATSSTPSPTPTTPPPPPALAWGPTEADVREWIDRAAQLELPEVAGQVIIARYTGRDPQTPADLVRDL